MIISEILHRRMYLTWVLLLLLLKLTSRFRLELMHISYNKSTRSMVMHPPDIPLLMLLLLFKDITTFNSTSRANQAE